MSKFENVLAKASELEKQSIKHQEKVMEKKEAYNKMLKLEFDRKSSRRMHKIADTRINPELLLSNISEMKSKMTFVEIAEIIGVKTKTITNAYNLKTFSYELCKNMISFFGESILNEGVVIEEIDNKKLVKEIKNLNKTQSKKSIQDQIGINNVTMDRILKNIGVSRPTEIKCINFFGKKILKT